MGIDNINGPGWPKGKFPEIDAMVKVAKAVDPEYREIKNSKQELDRLTGGLSAIKDKARVVRQTPLKARQKGNKDKAREKRLAKLTENLADLGLAADAPEARGLNDYQKIGIAQGALRAIEGLEARGPEAICTAAQGITCDNTQVKDSILGRLTGANSRHDAQRVEMMEKTGLLALAQLADFANYRSVKFLLGCGAAPHAALHAIGIAGWHFHTEPGGHMPVDRHLLAFEAYNAKNFNASRTRENMEVLGSLCREAKAESSDPREARKAELADLMLQNAFKNAGKHQNAWKALGEYRGALNVIDEYLASTGESDERVLAGAAESVLEEPLKAQRYKHSPSEIDRDYAGYRQYIGDSASDLVLAHEIKGGLSALKLLADNLICPNARDIFKLKLNPQEKLQALGRLGRKNVEYW